jgi:hypothetical protein
MPKGRKRALEVASKTDSKAEDVEQVSADIGEEAKRPCDLSGDKRVNGSTMDQWCPDTARNVEELWKCSLKHKKNSRIQRQFLVKSSRNFILRSSSTFLVNSHMMDYPGL